MTSSVVCAHGRVAAAGSSAPCSTQPMTLSLKRKSPSSVTTTTTAVTTAAAPAVALSYKQTLVTAVERTLLRTLAFVLHHLDRGHARYWVRSILRWHHRLQRQLPLCAANSLDKFAKSFVALSDAEFIDFWTSLADEPQPATSRGDPSSLDMEYISSMDLRDDDEDDAGDDREATFVKRMYRRIYRRIQWLCGHQPDEHTRYAQTPLTSPDDKYDEREFYRRRASLGFPSAARRPSFTNLQLDTDTLACLSLIHPYQEQDAVPIAGAFAEEPGWAVDYMEQDSTVPSELTLRMTRMMHSSIPLNLFRVEVVYPSQSNEQDENDDGVDGFVGVVTPDSFPPTPITRDLQTRRIHHYTATVLDHVTLALRLLDTNYCMG